MELQKLQNLLTDDVDTQAFSKYFIDNYTKIYAHLGYCYRKNTGINTIMRLESLQKTIKYFDLRCFKVKRLVKGIQAVLTRIRDKSVGRLLAVSS